MLISIITICVTLLLGVGGFIVNTLIQRRTNSIEVITKNRISRRNKTIEIMAVFIKYSDIKYLDNIIKNDQIDIAIKDIVSSFATLRSLYTKSFKVDLGLINITEELLNLIIDYLNGNSNIKEDIINTKVKFEKLFDLYINTEWSRIKAETIGKRKKGGVDKWMDDYKKTERYYNENCNC